MRGPSRSNKRGNGPSRGKGPRNQNGDGALMHVTHPPTIQEYAVRHGTRLRFVSNVAVDQDITFKNLMDTMLIATSSTALYDIFQMVKCRGVELWAAPLLGSAVNVGVAFDSVAAGELGDLRWHTDTSMGVQPAHVKARPSPKSQAAQFQPQSTAFAFHLTCPAGTVVDVELTFVQSAQLVSNFATNVGVGLTTGASYWRGLDGLAIATTKLTPVIPDAQA